MNATPKIDEYVKRLSIVKRVFDWDNIFVGCSDNVEELIKFQDRVLAMLTYRVLPDAEDFVPIPDKVDKETAKTKLLHRFRNVGDFDAFWYARNNCPLVTFKGLQDDFLAISPDLDSIPRFINAMNVKFEHVRYQFPSDIETIKANYSLVDEFVKEGHITKEDADAVYENLHIIANVYSSKWEKIEKIYEDLRKMAGIQTTSTTQIQLLPSDKAIAIQDNSTVSKGKQTLPTGEPQRTYGSFPIELQQELYNALIKGHLIDKSTDPIHFNHVFGGTPIPENKKPFKPIKWEESTILLGCMITTLFSESDEQLSMWVTAYECFLCKDKTGEYAPPNVNTMKSDASRILRNKKSPTRKNKQLVRMIAPIENTMRETWANAKKNTKQ
jgi:hypothetical protein